MDQSRFTGHNSEYVSKLSKYISKRFQQIQQDYVKISQDIPDEKSQTKSLLSKQKQKLSTIESKIQKVLELQSLGQDQFRITRENFDICESVTNAVEALQKKNGAAKSIETRFPEQKPTVFLNKTLFEKWIYWCILKIYQIENVKQLDIEIASKDFGVVVSINPIKVKGEVKFNPDGLDWLCVNRFFELENGSIKRQKNIGLRVSLPVSILSANRARDNGSEREIEILKRINDGDDLPTLSPIAVKIVQLASDTSSSARDIAKVITLDPVLTTRLLKIVNSPFYGFSNTVTSISQAVAILGMKAVRTLSLCISVLDTFPVDSDKTFDYQNFWMRSFASAVACKATARKLGIRIEEEAFIAGLTQNIGSLVFARYYPEKYGKILRQHYENSSELRSLEKQAWGIDHATVGSELFARWKMPVMLVQSILNHHTPSKVSDKNSDLKKLVTLVYLSDISSKVLYNENKSKHIQLLKSEYKNLLQIEDDGVDEIMEHVSSEVETVANEFDFSIEVPVNYAQILQDANAELSRIILDYEQINRELIKEKKRAEKLTQQLQKANKQLEEEVNTDGLTKLYNHRFFFELLGKEFSNALRHDLKLSCIMLDIDFFKSVNDSYGHQTGDVVLMGLGKVLTNAIRIGDFAARYGGEEFVVILPNTAIDEGRMVAERIRKSTENTVFTDKIEKGKITISAGVACFDIKRMKTAVELVELADKGVYTAKREGRNRVIIYSEKLENKQK